MPWWVIPCVCLIVIFVIGRSMREKEVEFKEEKVTKENTSNKEEKRKLPTATIQTGPKNNELSKLHHSVKILKTTKGVYTFGLAKIRTEGVKTVWLNDGNVPITGINYLFLEVGKSGRPLRRTDPSRRVILSCEEIIQPGNTFETLDMLNDRTAQYKVKLLEINPLGSCN